MDATVVGDDSHSSSSPSPRTPSSSAAAASELAPPTPPTKDSPRLERTSSKSAASSNNKKLNRHKTMMKAEHVHKELPNSPVAPPAVLDISQLPLSPEPHHLEPYLSPSSPLTPKQKRHLLTSVYLHSASAGNADTLEWLLQLPVDPRLSWAQNAANARRRVSMSVSLSGTNGNGNGNDEGDGGSEGQGEQRGQDGGGGGGVTEHELELPDSCPRKWIDLEARDDEGNSALGLCAALGHAEGVRVLVEAGVSVAGGDKAGWTPLHWAVQNNDIPIAAYLLNHRASPLLASHKGLTPRDLVKRGKDGAAMRDVLQSAHEAALERERQRLQHEMGVNPNGTHSEDDNDQGESSTTIDGHARSSSRASWAGSTMSALTPSWTNDPAKVEEERRASEMMRKKELALESARTLDVDLGVLGLGLRGTPKADDDDDEEGIPNVFVWDRCEPDQMLVFSLNDLGVIFDVVITTMKPVRQRAYRIIPANVVFLCARYAHYFSTPELLEELVVGAMERIEAAVHHRPDDMANCAFWLSNCLLLLYYLRKEPNLRRSTAEMQLHLRDLINEIFVFVIRDAERRIDRVLEPALLEHQPLPGLENVEFEGEWSSNRFVKKLTGGRKKSSASRSASVSSLFGSTAATELPGSGGGGGANGASSNGTSAATDEVVNSSGTVVEASPRSVTALLSSTLFILQMYEIPPAIVVQAFSQLFYWIGCELFNRLLTQRKYLCRSRAMHIRLNASSLEEWASQNRLPSKMVSIHFAPLNQLLQWLQCLSSEQAIDGLIGTIQSLRSLNPLQLRRAVREYRYEVDENHMSDDCVQYLVQIQSQWERMRLQKTVEGLAPGAPPPTQAELEKRSPSVDSEDAAEQQAKVTKMIDEVFSDPSAFGSYTPPGGTEAMGELLNSRYMLPFAVPTSAEMLVNFSSRDAFGPFASDDPSYAASVSSAQTLRRSFSAASISSSDTRRDSSSEAGDRRPSVAGSESSCGSSVGVDPDQRFTPVLPVDFFAVLDAARAKAAASRSRIKGAGTGRWKGLGVGGDFANGGNGDVQWYNWRGGKPAGGGGGAAASPGTAAAGGDANGAGDESESGGGGGTEESESGSETDHESSREVEVERTPRPRDGFE